jgi:hypothetical protein
LELDFLPTLHPVYFFLFFIYFWGNFSCPPTYCPPLSPSDLLTYIFKLKVNSFPSTFSLVNLKCAIFISTHTPIYLSTYPSIYLPICPSTFLPTKPHLHAAPTYMVATPIDPQRSTMMMKELNEGIEWSLVLFTQTNK